ncbi:MAG: hypothetical protein JW783_15720 [Bacteroidales bacterium]|nr:hypothetical protein [Bacteroidales bacterium]MBN2748007.1 hypothetical protein [Bacteroidales bacterium]
MKEFKSQQNQSASATANTSDVPKKNGSKKELTEVTVFRKDIDLGAEDKYGHWWTKITPNESYGWWPKKPVGLSDTLFGTEGELNGVTSFKGTATKDPHHIDTSGDEYKVISESGKPETQIQDEMRSFAKSYSGEWRWTFGAGQNCHTFQKDMLQKSNLKVEKK